MSNALSYTNQQSEITGSQIKAPVVVKRNNTQDLQQSDTKLQQ